MKKLSFILIAMLVGTSYTNAQIQLKKKTEKKANQVIDDFLFGKKKKKKNQEDSSTQPTSPTSGTDGGEVDDYTPNEVDFSSLDLSKSVHFSVLIDLLPERTQGFSRDGKPQGSRYSTQGVSFSTGMKNYSDGEREMTITLNDYLGAEFYANAQSAQQFEYESTEGFAKSIEIDGIPGWVNIEYGDNDGTLFLYLEERFYATVNTTNTSEEELKAIASDIKLSRLKAELGK